MSLEGFTRQAQMLRHQAPRIIGLNTAPDHLISGISDIHYLGVNSQIVPYRDGFTCQREPCWRVPYTVSFPTGSLPYMIWQLTEFAREHHLMRDVHYDATR